MKTTTLLIALFALSAGICRAQVDMSFHMGSGTFRMKTQKELQKDFRGSQLPWRTVHKFPPYWIYSGSISYKFHERLGVGAALEYGSTGGTLHYADYSGSVRLDQLLRYVQYSLITYAQVNTSKKWPLFVTVHFSMVNTKEKLNYRITVGNASEQESSNFTSGNFGLRQGLMLQHKVKSHILLHGSVGLEMQFPGTLRDKDGVVLVKQDGENVTAQWSGLRASVGVGLILNKTKKVSE
jgi:hypothetical protein